MPPRAPARLTTPRRSSSLAAALVLAACGAADDASTAGEATSAADASSTGSVATADVTHPTTDASASSGAGTTDMATSTGATSTGAGDTSTGAPGTSTGDAPADAWVLRFGAPDDQRPSGLGFDAQGAVWVAGDFFGALDLGGGPLAGAGTGVYLGKFAPDGSPLHSQALFPADGEAKLTNVTDLAVDGAGAVVVTGWLEGAYTIGGEPLVADELDFYVGKWDADGAPLWGRRFGQSDWQVSEALTVGADDTIWIAGASLAPFAVGDIELTGTASTGMFVVRLDPDGAPLSGTWWGDAGDQEIRGISRCDDGSVAISGFFNDVLTFGADTIEPVGDKDMFVASLDPDGQPAWIRAFGGPGTDHAPLVRCTDAVAFAGVVTGPAQFGELALDPAGDADVVLARLDDDGALTWAAGVTGPDDQLPTGLVAGPDGALMLALTAAGATQFGALDHASAGATDLLLATYADAAASPTQIVSLGDRDVQRSGPLALGPDGAAALAGTIAGTVAWPGLAPVTAEGPADLVLVRFTPQP